MHGVDIHTQRAYARKGARARSLARGLGYFSIGLGLAELFAPQVFTRFLGLGDRETLVRSYGLREIGTGLGVLSSTDPSSWIWGRVGGDALDLATLSLGMDRDNPQRDNVVMAAVAVGGITALDLYCAQELDASRRVSQAPDYSHRTGFPRGLGASRGVAAEMAHAMRPRFVTDPPRVTPRTLASAR
jgi:hypothetical protein